MKLISTGIVLAALSLGGCSELRTERQEFDSLVEEVWVEDFEFERAVDFLARGGKHFPFNPTADKEFVIPLCEQIESLGAKCHAMYGEFESQDIIAWVLVELPRGENVESQVRELIAEADARCDIATIGQEWGNRWMTFHFDEFPDADELAE
jgi:hypothetical protein